MSPKKVRKVCQQEIFWPQDHHQFCKIAFSIGLPIFRHLEILPIEFQTTFSSKIKEKVVFEPMRPAFFTALRRETSPPA